MPAAVAPAQPAALAAALAVALAAAQAEPAPARLRPPSWRPAMVAAGAALASAGPAVAPAAAALAAAEGSAAASAAAPGRAPRAATQRTTLPTGPSGLRRERPWYASATAPGRRCYRLCLEPSAVWALSPPTSPPSPPSPPWPPCLRLPSLRLPSSSPSRRPSPWSASARTSASPWPPVPAGQLEGAGAAGPGQPPVGWGLGQRRYADNRGIAEGFVCPSALIRWGFPCGFRIQRPPGIGAGTPGREVFAWKTARALDEAHHPLCAPSPEERDPSEAHCARGACR